jgi:effector-binding domain-containing protein
MQITRKTNPATLVLEATARLIISEIPAHAEKIIPALLAEAEARGMTISGPCLFIYEGCDGSPDREFTLRIAFPVDICLGQGAFDCLEIPAHECLSTQYKGAMHGIGPAWSRFTPAARELGLALQPVGREVYLHWIDQDSAGNLVELQIPLAP